MSRIDNSPSDTPVITVTQEFLDELDRCENEIVAQAIEALRPRLAPSLREQIEDAACGCIQAADRHDQHNQHARCTHAWCNVCGRSRCHRQRHSDEALLAWWHEIQHAPYEQRHLTIAYFMPQACDQV